MPKQINYNIANEIKFNKFKAFCEKLKKKYNLDDAKFLAWVKKQALMRPQTEEEVIQKKFKIKFVEYLEKNSLIRNTAMNWILCEKYKNGRNEHLNSISKEMVKKYKKGYTIKELAEEYNLSMSAARIAIFVYQKTNKKEAFIEIKNKILELYKNGEGLTINEIAKKLKMPYATVYSRLHPEYQITKGKEYTHNLLGEILTVYNISPKENSISAICEKMGYEKQRIYYQIRTYCKFNEDGTIEFK